MLKHRLANRILGAWPAISRRVRRTSLKVMGAKLGRCHLKRISIPRNPWDIEIGDGTYIDDHTVLLSTGEPRDERRIVIGQTCGFNRFTIIDASESIRIGNYVRVGPNCYITDHDHGFRRDEKVCRQPLTSSPVEIHDDVWIGAGAIVLKGVTIGEGAVVAAGAVVTKPIDPWAVVAGIPAKQISVRA